MAKWKSEIEALGKSFEIIGKILQEANEVHVTDCDIRLSTDGPRKAEIDFNILVSMKGGNAPFAKIRRKNE